MHLFFYILYISFYNKVASFCFETILLFLDVYKANMIFHPINGGGWVFSFHLFLYLLNSWTTFLLLCYSSTPCTSTSGVSACAICPVLLLLACGTQQLQSILLYNGYSQ